MCGLLCVRAAGKADDDLPSHCFRLELIRNARGGATVHGLVKLRELASKHDRTITEERRKQLARKVHEIAEHGRTAIRLERRDANEALKKLLKEKKISEDDEKRGLDQVQKQTDLHIRQVDELAKHKEDEILKI